MPHLGIDTTAKPTPNDRSNCIEAMTDQYVSHMVTEADHVAVTLRSHPTGSMAIGRAIDGPIVVLLADIRQGRSVEQRRSFTLSCFAWFEEQWDVPRQNAKIVFTEHPGDHMMGANRVGGEWTPD